MGLKVSSPARKIGWDEIRDRGYIVAHDKVYDAPAYISQNKHPPCITMKLGTDCSFAYDQHRTGKKIWAKYQIGVTKYKK